jgi:hypothetical protein
MDGPYSESPDATVKMQLPQALVEDARAHARALGLTLAGYVAETIACDLLQARGGRRR